MHSIAVMKPADSMRASSLHIKTDQLRKRMDANQTHAGAWIHDEALQNASTLLLAASLRITNARHHTYKPDTARYAEPSENFDIILFFALCGDHLQLPAVPKSSGLLAPPDNTSDEHKVGASMFSRIRYFFEMHIMACFEDSMLIAILQKCIGSMVLNQPMQSGKHC